MLHCQERFFEIYHREAEAVAFCPYRICPIGAHSDHNLGKITGLAIDKGIHLAYRSSLTSVPSGMFARCRERRRTTGPTTCAAPR